MQNTPGCLTGRDGPGPSSHGRPAVRPRPPRGVQGAHRNSCRREASNVSLDYPAPLNVDTAACAPKSPSLEGRSKSSTRKAVRNSPGQAWGTAELCGLQHDHAEIGEFACNGRLAALKVRP